MWWESILSSPISAIFLAILIFYVFYYSGTLIDSYTFEYFLNGSLIQRTFCSIHEARKLNDQAICRFLANHFDVKIEAEKQDVNKTYGMYMEQIKKQREVTLLLFDRVNMENGKPILQTAINPYSFCQSQSFNTAKN